MPENDDQNQNDDQNDDGGTGGGGTSSTATARTFTQDDVDRIVSDRLKRVKTEPPADYEELKTAKAELDRIREEQMSELERERTARENAEKQAQDASARAREALVRSAVVAEAARRNAVDPDAVLALLDRGSLEFDDDGVPTNAASAVESLLKAKSYLVDGGGGDPDLGARGKSAGADQLARSDLKNMSPEEIVKARREGRLDAVSKGS